MTGRRVLVLNHFAVPRGYPGGTRHVELFGRLADWSSCIVASRLNLTTGKPQRRQRGFIFVPVAPYEGNGPARILNWLSYALSAMVVGLTQPRVDIVYASSPHLFAAFAGWVVSRLKSKPFVLEIRDLWPQVLLDMGRARETSLSYRWLKALEQFLYSEADAIVIMATGSATHIAKCGVPTEKIHYIPNAADSADFVPSAPRGVLRDRYQFTRVTAVYAGAHGPANGLNLLLDAAKDVMDLDLEIVLIGGGVEKEALIDRVTSEGISNVRFMDPVPKVEIADIYAASDIGLHVLADVPLFRYGVSPNKIFEYMAAGLPIITNCPGVVEEVVTAAGAGMAVAPDALATALRQIVTSARNDLEHYRVSGLEWTEGNSRSVMATRLAAVLDRVTMPSTDSPGNAHRVNKVGP